MRFRKEPPLAIRSLFTPETWERFLNDDENEFERVKRMLDSDELKLEEYRVLSRIFIYRWQLKYNKEANSGFADCGEKTKCDTVLARQIFCQDLAAMKNAEIESGLVELSVKQYVKVLAFLKQYYPDGVGPEFGYDEVKSELANLIRKEARGTLDDKQENLVAVIVFELQLRVLSDLYHAKDKL